MQLRASPAVRRPEDKAVLRPRGGNDLALALDGPADGRTGLEGQRLPRGSAAVTTASPDQQPLRPQALAE